MYTLGVAIFIDKTIANESILETYQTFFQNQGMDVFVISNSNNNIPKNLGVIPSFYLKFYQGAVLFIDLDDYLSYGHDLLSKDIYLYTTAEQLIERNISKNMLKNIKLTNIINDKIEVISNDRL